MFYCIQSIQACQYARFSDFQRVDKNKLFYINHAILVIERLEVVICQITTKCFLFIEIEISDKKTRNVVIATSSLVFSCFYHLFRSGTPKTNPVYGHSPLPGRMSASSSEFPIHSQCTACSFPVSSPAPAFTRFVKNSYKNFFKHSHRAK